MGYIRVYSGNSLIKQFQLDESRVTIGRTNDNTIVLPDSGVSKRHAAIVYKDGDYYITNLGSSNGVFVNDFRVENEKLKYWDEIQIHNFVIKFMAKPGIGLSKQESDETPSDIESDKTEFFEITDKEQLDNLRNKKKQCFITYSDSAGETQKLMINKPRIVIGKSRDADIQLKGWFAPSVAATIERLGNNYELVPTKRGKVIFKSQWVTSSSRLNDGSGFIVRDREFTFFNRLSD